MWLESGRAGVGAQEIAAPAPFHPHTHMSVPRPARGAFPSAVRPPGPGWPLAKAEAAPGHSLQGAGASQH